MAAEIHRVLRDGGVVYADTPFMQQVHEGPYDFTRFTESGHRYLFRDFAEVESGQVAGAGTSLRWSISYFFRALTRSVALGRIAGLAFFWEVTVQAEYDPDGWQPKILNTGRRRKSGTDGVSNGRGVGSGADAHDRERQPSDLRRVHAGERGGRSREADAPQGVGESGMVRQLDAADQRRRPVCRLRKRRDEYDRVG